MDNIIKWSPVLAIFVGITQAWFIQRDKKLSIVASDALKDAYLPTEQHFKVCFSSAFTKRNKDRKLLEIQTLLITLENLSANLYFSSPFLINLKKIATNGSFMKIKKLNKLLIACSDDYWFTYEKYRSASGFQKLGYSTRNYQNLFIRRTHKLRIQIFYFSVMLLKGLGIIIIVIAIDVILAMLSK
ncbi:hypothetical protein [Listeria rustica]|uniref:Uncharacterized protein n=1 Tax=Listeria rustica TaxID=2713503 RepID=A0A7W1T4V5_9LIST|nr:hypothetical protein [Listeria rustica]MBA3925525.1 hypothetical protein [Listeria rustica]